MKHLLHLLIALSITTLLYAQAPQKMTYQAVIRDATSTLIQKKMWASGLVYYRALQQVPLSIRKLMRYRPMQTGW